MAANDAARHWADEKETVSSARPIKFLLFLLSKLPTAVVLAIAFPVSLFYLLTSRRARRETLRYQKQLRSFSGGAVPRIISPYRQILSFSLCVVEKLEGWLGKVEYDNLERTGSDLAELCALLERGAGAVLIGSHLGNIELLRSLSSFDRTGVSRKIPVYAIMESNATAQFNKALDEINPNAGFNVIDPADIGPDTIGMLMEQLERGGLVVFTADRTSARARSRCIREQFLGKAADFPYGVFLLTALLDAPTFFVFGLRTKTAAVFPRYRMFIERAKTAFSGKRSERDAEIRQLCREFIRTLEKYCVQFPYQWYNFYDFWLLQDE